MPAIMGTIADIDKAALFNLLTLITGDEAGNILSGSVQAHKHDRTVTITYTHFARGQYVDDNTKIEKSVVVQIGE